MVRAPGAVPEGPGFKPQSGCSFLWVVSKICIQVTLGDDSQCTVIIVYLTNTDLGDDNQCTRGKAVQLQILQL